MRDAVPLACLSHSQVLIYRAPEAASTQTLLLRIVLQCCDTLHETLATLKTCHLLANRQFGKLKKFHMKVELLLENVVFAIRRFSYTLAVVSYHTTNLRQGCAWGEQEEKLVV